MKVITWSLVRAKGLISRSIGWFGAGYYSHIDVVTPEGALRGARSDRWAGVDPGYQDRPWAYAAPTWQAWTLYSSEVSDEQYERYWDFSDAKLGAPYDERSLLAAFLFGHKHKLRDRRSKWVGWCSQEVALNGEHAGLWAIPPEVIDVTPGDCAYLFAGRHAKRTEMVPS
jgi:hypothetical protein